jgi:uncharacterized RDD family membrane protein YckC
VKCPKCSYLGFETGDRCRNCGYDFSLISHGDPQPIDPDLEMRSTHAKPESPSDWLIRAEATQPSSTVPIQPAVSASKPRLSRGSKLPLFTSANKADEPLIRLPVTPRPPLSVRRTPDSPRLQVVSRAVRAVEREPALEFETARATPQRDDFASVAPPPVPRTSTQRSHEARAEVPIALSGPLTRVVAAAIDHVLLLAIDAGVIYFTLRIAGLSMDEWGALPVLPLFSFLLLLKLAYFCAFTAVGGQTIGKMALRIRVVSDDNGAIDATLALRRTVVGAVSTAFLGLGMLPAFFDPERRAFHDRVARTRVVGLRTA